VNQPPSVTTRAGHPNRAGEPVATRPRIILFGVGKANRREAMRRADSLREEGIAARALFTVSTAAGSSPSMAASGNTGRRATTSMMPASS
jgi:hypothetical protein